MDRSDGADSGSTHREWFDGAGRYGTPLTRLNVKRQGLTTQLKDYLAYAERQTPPLEFKLYVRDDTELSKPLKAVVDEHRITLIKNLPKVLS